MWGGREEVAACLAIGPDWTPPATSPISRHFLLSFLPNRARPTGGEAYSLLVSTEDPPPSSPGSEWTNSSHRFKEIYTLFPIPSPATFLRALPSHPLLRRFV